MTTIVIHGTLAKGSSWYWNSWGERGFCRVLADTMEKVSGSHDVWRVNGKPVNEIPALNEPRQWSMWHGDTRRIVTSTGRFEWDGAPEGLMRGIAADSLVNYLNVLRELTDEPIRIVAHSHGCNVMKLASTRPELAPAVHIAKAVFLACPHFWEPNTVFEEPKNWMDRFDFKKLKPVLKGKKYRYRASPQRFGKILNLYSSQDKVQCDVAAIWSGAYAPQTGNFLKDLWHGLSTGDVYETDRHAEREDSDPEAKGLYENYEVPVWSESECVAVHSAMHGATVAKLAGYWLASKATVPELMAKYGALPVVPEGDDGE